MNAPVYCTDSITYCRINALGNVILFSLPMGEGGYRNHLLPYSEHPRGEDPSIKFSFKWMESPHSDQLWGYIE